MSDSGEHSPVCCLCWLAATLVPQVASPLWWPQKSWPSHLSVQSSKNKCPSKLGRRHMVLYDLASEVTYPHFHCPLLVIAVTDPPRLKWNFQVWMRGVWRICSHVLKLLQCKTNNILLATWKTCERAAAVGSVTTSGSVMRKSWVRAEQENTQTAFMAEMMEEPDAATWEALALLAPAG